MRLHPLVVAVREAITAHRLMAATGPVVVACSGGADSLALLHALHTLCAADTTRRPGVRLHVAHLDHGVRGSASAEDASFVRQLATAWGLDHTIGCVSQQERATWRGSLEASLRGVRYGFLREVATSIGAQRIMLGHTADDQAETVLMHLLRGSGLDGLAGMAAYSTNGLARPLLHCWRADTVAYCRAMGLSPRQDATNTDRRYLRNRVRLELLPLLTTYQASIRATLARNADMIAADRDYLDAAVADVWPECVTECALGTITLRRERVRVLHPAVRYRVLRHAITLVGSSDPDAQVNADTIQRLDRVVTDHSGERRRVECSTGAVAYCDWERIAIVRRQ